MSTPASRSERNGFDYDVVVVGGGPAGCSAGVFTARYGLDTAIFDRGRSSLQRCAHLENYLGFPAGIDIETLYGLLHDHAEEAGCAVAPDLVESVTRVDGDGDRDGGDGGFLVEPQEGEAVTAARVVAATRYDGEYLRPLDGDEMFESSEHDGEEYEQFDRSYPDADGTTPVEGLYVASPSAEADRQAIVAAGRGARVGLTLVDDVRRERGYFDPFDTHHDWVRKEAELNPEWADRDRWREYADGQRPEDHDLDDERWAALREEQIDRRFAAYISDEEVERRRRRAQKRLLTHLDDDAVLERAREIASEGEGDRE
ncbi:FAD-dependent oxidoreductase [Halobium salinum]|uniref:FAD-dependent oxidoreductase n=1 Tax=Halobium salinum TaxID=1364940 RepID=A0ABD5PCP5_9EURY|nr:FAD-dependent oxidoreductase [Halobium salinum]